MTRAGWRVPSRDSGAARRSLFAADGRGGRFALAAALAALLPTLAAGAECEPVRVAVASNFLAAAREAGVVFERATGCPLSLSAGSTGQLYAQIAQGAPFEVFLAADSERPERAEREGLAVPGSRRTYAVGRLVLFSPTPGLPLSGQTLADPAVRRVALANPRTAPYGRAALEAARTLGLESALASRQVVGTNVAQALSFVLTGNAEVGFVALSQVVDRPGSSWLIPETLHSPIRQQGVVLARGRRAEAAAFLDFLASGEIRELLARRGYRTD